MSKKNGDKARFAKQRQDKMLRRKRLREQQKAMIPGLEASPIQAESK